VPWIRSSWRGLGPASARISHWSGSAIQSGASSVGPSEYVAATDAACLMLKARSRRSARLLIGYRPHPRSGIKLCRVWRGARAFRWNSPENRPRSACKSVSRSSGRAVRAGQKMERNGHALETPGVRLSRTRRFRRCTGRLNATQLAVSISLQPLVHTWIGGSVQGRRHGGATIN
jgi:hypothetical protein